MRRRLIARAARRVTSPADGCRASAFAVEHLGVNARRPVRAESAEAPRASAAFARVTVLPSFGAVLLALAGCDGGWTLSDQSRTKPADGQPLTLQVVGTRACTSTTEPAAPPLLGVELELTGWHAGGVPASFFYASLLDGNGKSYRAIPSGCEPVLAGPPLGVGESTRGFVTFPRPLVATATNATQTIVYAPRLAGEAEPRTRIELPLTAP